MGVKHTVLLDGQLPTIAFTVLTQLCGPKANKTEMGAALFTKNGEGRKFDIFLTCKYIHFDAIPFSGSVYWQTENGILLMSCYQVLLCASQLFMASVIHAHFSKSMPVFSLEQAEGVGKSYELVIHAFVRIASLTVLPLLLCSAIIYLCTVTDLDLWKFFVTTIFHMQLNHVWISIIMLSACSVPRYSTLICPLLSAVSGFAGGFLVPEPEMPAFYYWLFYINPTHWAYSSTMNVLMDDVVFGCESQSRLECQKKVGTAILHQFGFDQVNPYRNMVIMIFLLILFLASTMAAVELRHTDKLKRWRRHFGKFWKENKRR